MQPITPNSPQMQNSSHNMTENSQINKQRNQIIINSHQSKGFEFDDINYMKEMDQINFDIEQLQKDKDQHIYPKFHQNIQNKEQNDKIQVQKQNYSQIQSNIISEQEKMELEEGQQESDGFYIQNYFNKYQIQKQHKNERIIEQQNYTQKAEQIKQSKTVFPDYLIQGSLMYLDDKYPGYKTIEYQNIQNQENQDQYIPYNQRSYNNNYKISQTNQKINQPPTTFLIEHIDYKTENKQYSNQERHKIQLKDQTKQQFCSLKQDKQSSSSYSLSQQRKKQERQNIFLKKNYTQKLEKHCQIERNQQKINEEQMQDQNSQCIQQFKGQQYQISGNLSYTEQNQVFKKYILNMRKTLRRQYEKCRLRHQNIEKNSKYNDKQILLQQQQQSQNNSQIKQINQRQFMIYYKRQLQTKQLLSKQKQKLQYILKQRQNISSKIDYNQSKIQQKNQFQIRKQKQKGILKNQSNLLIQPDLSKNQKLQNIVQQGFQKIKFSKIKQNAYNSAKFRSYLRLIMLQMSNYIDMTDKVQLVFKMDYRKLMAYYMDIVGPQQMIRYESFREEDSEEDQSYKNESNERKQSRYEEKSQNQNCDEMRIQNQKDNTKYSNQDQIINQKINQVTQQLNVKQPQRINEEFQKIIQQQQRPQQFNLGQINENCHQITLNYLQPNINEQLKQYQNLQKNVQIYKETMQNQHLQVCQSQIKNNNQFQKNIKVFSQASMINQQGQTTNSQQEQKIDTRFLQQHNRIIIHSSTSPKTPRFQSEVETIQQLQLQNIISIPITIQNRYQSQQQPISHRDYEHMNIQNIIQEQNNIPNNHIENNIEQNEAENSYTPQFVQITSQNNHSIQSYSFQVNSSQIHQNMKGNQEYKNNQINIIQDQEEQVELNIPIKNNERMNWNQEKNNQNQFSQFNKKQLNVIQIEQQSQTNKPQILSHKQHPTNNQTNSSTIETFTTPQKTISIPPSQPAISATHIRIVLLQTYPSLSQMINCATDEQILALYEELSMSNNQEQMKDEKKLVSEKNELNQRNYNNQENQIKNNEKRQNMDKNQSQKMLENQENNKKSPNNVNNNLNDINESFLNKKNKQKQLNLIDLEQQNTIIYNNHTQNDQQMNISINQYSINQSSMKNNNSQFQNSNNTNKLQLGNSNSIINESQGNVKQVNIHLNLNQSQASHTSQQRRSLQQQPPFKQIITFQQLQFLIQSLIKSNPQIEEHIKQLSKQELLELYKQGMNQNKRQLNQINQNKETNKEINKKNIQDEFLKKNKGIKKNKEVIDLEDEEQEEGEINKNEIGRKQSVNEADNNLRQSNYNTYSQNNEIQNQSKFSYIQIHQQNLKKLQENQQKIKKYWKGPNTRTFSQKIFIKIDYQRLYQYLQSIDYQNQLTSILKNPKTRNQKAQNISLLYVKQMKKLNLKNMGFQEYLNDENNKIKTKKIILPWNKSPQCIKNSKELKQLVDKDRKLTVEIPKLTEERKKRILQLKQKQKQQMFCTNKNKQNQQFNTVRKPLKRCVMLIYEQPDERDLQRLQEQIRFDNTRKRTNRSYQLQTDPEIIHKTLKNIIDVGFKRKINSREERMELE